MHPHPAAAQRAHYRGNRRHPRTGGAGHRRPRLGRRRKRPRLPRQVPARLYRSGSGSRRRDRAVYSGRTVLRVVLLFGSQMNGNPRNRYPGPKPIALANCFNESEVRFQDIYEQLLHSLVSSCLRKVRLQPFPATEGEGVEQGSNASRVESDRIGKCTNSSSSCFKAYFLS